uniref:Uncharacterized protein n=1 Tax=Loa loa TaxID=7209 RepID=A0A1I7VER2_LOALO
MLDGIISRANDLEVEWRELLRSANDDEWENNVAFYEYLYEEDCLFDKGTKIYCERVSLLTKLNRISEAIIKVKMKCEKIDHEPAAIAGKSPTSNPVEFDGNPRMWGQFISQFEESIHRRTDLTPTQKFMHLLRSLKGAAREQISDLIVNEENYPLALENLYERYGDKKQRKELYKSLERARCSNKEPFRMIRKLLNLLSQLKGLRENIETAQLDVMVTDRIPEDMGKGLKKKYSDPEWTMEDTIKYLKEKMIEESEVILLEKGNLVDRTKMQRARSN